MKNKNIFDPNNNEMTHAEFSAFIAFIAFIMAFMLFSASFRSLVKAEESSHLNNFSLSDFSIEQAEYQISEYFNTDYYKRVNYLTSYCELIPGLEAVNNEKSSFRCRDGKIYLEYIPKDILLSTYKEKLIQ